MMKHSTNIELTIHISVFVTIILGSKVTFFRLNKVFELGTLMDPVKAYTSTEIVEFSLDIMSCVHVVYWVAKLPTLLLKHDRSWRCRMQVQNQHVNKFQ